MSAAARDPQPQGRLPGPRGRPGGQPRRSNPARSSACSAPTAPGKTTTLLTIAGELAPVDGLVMFSNVPTFTPMYQRVRDGGIGLVTEDRLVFTKMSTRDNLRIGGGIGRARALELFPELEPRLSVRGGMLSGGEQQMLALARALSREPALLLADELSLGLAPHDRRPAARRGAHRRRRARHRRADRRAARPQGAQVQRPHVPDGARPDPARAARSHEAIATARRDRGGLSPRYLRDRGRPHRAQAPQGQAQGVATSAGPRAGARPAHRENRLHQKGRR